MGEVEWKYGFQGEKGMIQVFQELNKTGSHPFKMNNGGFQLLWHLDFVMYIEKNSVTVCFSNASIYSPLESTFFVTVVTYDEKSKCQLKKCATRYI